VISTSNTSPPLKRRQTRQRSVILIEMLSGAVALQELETVGRWQSEIVEARCGVELPQPHGRAFAVCGANRRASRS
jgi:hypothetical protein